LVGHHDTRYDGDYRRRLELIQDTKFPVACQRVKTSRDGRFLFATGTYPPQIKVYELSQLSMKFERHLDAQIVQFQVLSLSLSLSLCTKDHAHGCV
jgi:ribosome biogenesis protein ENP2